MGSSVLPAVKQPREMVFRPPFREAVRASAVIDLSRCADGEWQGFYGWRAGQCVLCVAECLRVPIRLCLMVHEIVKVDDLNAHQSIKISI